MESYEINARDGMIGKVKDLYFDDQKWAVRYVVVDTGTWLSGRKVLISAAALIRPDPDTRTLLVELTQEQVENSPSMDTSKPLSRHHEEELHKHYGWPHYWTAGTAGTSVPPTAMPASAPPAGALRTTGGSTEPAMGESRIDPAVAQRESAPHNGMRNLHSAHTVRNYHIEASNGSIGHLEDLVIDDDTWSVRYLLVNTRNWLPGKKVIVSPDWVQSINPEEGSIRVDLTREAIKGSPEFDLNQPITSEYTERLNDYYGSPWR